MPPTRDWIITYGGFSVGGSTARQIQGEPRATLNNNYETETLEFDFITSAASDAAFTAECLACEDAFRKPRQDMTFTQGGSTFLSLKQSDNTGLDCNPSITKVGDTGDTGRSRRYHVSLEFGRAADNISLGGRQFSAINVEFSPSRQMTVTISGVYTALPSSTNAFETYWAAITAYASASLSAIATAVGQSAAVWEKIGEPRVEQNATNKYLNFTVVFKNILYEQAINVRNNPEIVDPELNISVERFSWDSSADSGFRVGGSGSSTEAPDYGPLGNTSGGDGSHGTAVMGSTGGPGQTTTGGAGTEKPWIINIRYTTAIDATLTTTLVSEYATVIRPFLIQEAVNRSQGTNITLIEDKPSYDPYLNRINATMQFIVYNNNLIEQHVTISDKTNFGQVLTGLWSANPYDYYKFQGPAIRLRRVLEEFVAIDTYNGAVMRMIESKATPFSGDPTSSLGQNWTVVSREPRGTSIQRTIPGSPASPWIASWQIETVLQYGNYRTAGRQNAGQVNGGGGDNSVAT
jgi:hypothetical protein